MYTSILKWLAVGVLPLFLAASALTGCEADDPGEPEAPGEPVAEDVAEEQEGEEDAPAPVGEELLAKTSFGNGFRPWYVSRWGEGNEDLAPGLASDPEHGTVVDFPLPVAGGISLVQNLYDLDESLRGRELVLQATGVADAQGELAIQMQYEIDGEVHSVEPAHPGDGEWGEWEASAQIPEDAHPEHIRVQVFRRYVDEPSDIPVRMASASLRMR